MGTLKFSLLFLLFPLMLAAQSPKSIQNGKVKFSVSVDQGKLLYDQLETNEIWSLKYGYSASRIETDANFGVEVIWTGWRAPGMPNNAQGKITLTKEHFKVNGVDVVKEEGAEIIRISMSGTNSPFELRLDYSLGKDDFFVRKSIHVSDKQFEHHFLHAIHPVLGKANLHTLEEQSDISAQIRVEGSDEYMAVDEIETTIDSHLELIKEGAFGQPCALKTKDASAFFGFEYPTSENRLKILKDGFKLDCYKLYGKLIDSIGTQSEAVVMALTPDPYLRKWYWDYVESIRIAPAEPYTLYNSWYDLRSVEYPRVPEKHWMNVENVNRMIDKVHTNMTEKNNIKVDAFVLDDGWDVYESDWKMRGPQFPNGMKPFSDKLAKNGTDLGIWFGPIGGYSFRMKRINWMIENGYEGIDREYEYCAAFLCMGGDKYKNLFKKRTVDQVKNDGVKYFKWDGIIFSCNDPSHGHAIGEYSPGAIMESVSEICDAVREANPDVYLNITTGTWLSPWWTKYSNQIWMDGADYAFANVPSLTKRDNAITYRDFVLYEDLTKKDLWFPIANLMTHGIIKGKLDHIGGTDEPLDKFTDNALLYVARGVSMWELYISPDILTDGEWSAIAKSLAWAKDRKDILKRTEMIGGNPTIGETYGYAHFQEDEGVVALRNPKVDQETFKLKLAPEYGLNETAANLVVEQVYPKHYIYPQLYSAGATVDIELNDFETAVFEIYPLEKATKPLVAGITFDEEVLENGSLQIKWYGDGSKRKILNPETVKSLKENGKELALYELKGSEKSPSLFLPVPQIAKKSAKRSSSIKFSINNTIQKSQIGFLLKTKEGVDDKILEKAFVKINGKKVEASVQKQKGKWMWQLANAVQGENEFELEIPKEKGISDWKGKIEVWNFEYKEHEEKALTIIPVKQVNLKPLPPKPWSDGIYKKTHKLGEINFD